MIEVDRSVWLGIGLVSQRRVCHDYSVRMPPPVLNPTLGGLGRFACRTKMLNPKALPEVLGEVLSSGVQVAALVNRNGMLLGCAGDSASATLAGAIGANLWQCHERCEGAGALECMLMECDEGRVALKAVGSYVIVCCTDSSVPFGQLKAKTHALHEFLQGPLRQLG